MVRLELWNGARGEHEKKPATDVLIFACAAHYGAALEAADEVFVRVLGETSA